MSIYITAQITGFLGYIFLTSAPNFKTKNQIIQTDILACSFLCLQWAMLGQPTLLILNILNMSISIFVLKFEGSPVTKNATVSMLLIGCLALMIVSQGTIIDALCIVAFCLMLRAKISSDIITFRSFSILAGITFALCGILAASIPAILFNILLVLFHLEKIRELNILQIRNLQKV